MRHGSRFRWSSLAVALSLVACGERGGGGAAGGALRVADALGDPGDAGGYERALAVPELSFPRDHGAHRGFRTEWWYVTGNLDAEGGRRFGVQLVFFRQALAPAAADAPERPAALAARELIFAHAAVSDVDGGRFHHAERSARAVAGLGEVTGGAGAPLRLVCADWTAEAAADGDGLLPLDLHAGDRDFSFSLRVAQGKPIVLQGERGLSRKSAEPGNASIYYSLTRLPIAGTIEVDGTAHDVKGLAWIDREWSTSALAPDQVGWDWFSLQLDDGTEVMWYQLRRADGGRDSWSRGCLVAEDGAATPLLSADVRATPTGAWTAPDGAATYPAAWRLVASAPAFDLAVTPLLPDQELHTLVRYWEGAVAVRGTRAGRPVAGRGYLEMTGYAR